MLYGKAEDEMNTVVCNQTLKFFFSPIALSELTLYAGI